MDIVIEIQIIADTISARSDLFHVFLSASTRAHTTIHYVAYDVSGAAVPNTLFHLTDGSMQAV